MLTRGPKRALPLAPWLLAGLSCLLALPVAASEPARCVARWQGPAEGCALQEPVTAEALGANEKSATKKALRNLEHAIQAARAKKAAILPAGARTLFLSDSEQCTDLAAEQAVTSCFPEPHLRGARYCWLELELDLCRQSQGFFVEGRAWTWAELQRAAICGEPPETPFADGEPVDAQQATCQAECWTAGRLSCGANRGM